MIENTVLSEVSKLAIDICNELGIPCYIGKGYATLDGNQISDLDYEELF